MLLSCRLALALLVLFAANPSDGQSDGTAGPDPDADPNFRPPTEDTAFDTGPVSVTVAGAAGESYRGWLIV